MKFLETCCVCAINIIKLLEISSKQLSVICETKHTVYKYMLHGPPVSSDIVAQTNISDLIVVDFELSLHFLRLESRDV